MTTTPHQQQVAKGWMPDDSTFGARLALIRQRMQWGNVREAALACGIPPESWRTWERDNVTPRRIVEMSTLIAQRTGCDLGWLIAGAAMASRIEVAEQVNERSPQPSRTAAIGTTRRATSHPPTTPGQRRPRTVRAPGFTIPTDLAA